MNHIQNAAEGAPDASTKAAAPVQTFASSSPYHFAMGYMKRAEAREVARRQQPATRRIYMSFFVRGGGEWVVSFLEADVRTPIGRGYCFGSADKVRELIAKTPTKLQSEDRRAFEHAILNGRGGLWLEVLEEQWAKLKRQKPA